MCTRYSLDIPKPFFIDLNGDVVPVFVKGDRFPEPISFVSKDQFLINRKFFGDGNNIYQEFKEFKRRIL
jgi:hypothetical protein